MQLIHNKIQMGKQDYECGHFLRCIYQLALANVFYATYHVNMR